ncbi:MAG TPA: ABC transporter permease [Syntrophorhabdaceae bacterium]|nr:ABC transporter permease [Syntrophorhabdaceae bacterium]
MNLFRNGKIQHIIDIIIVLTQKELKVRYKSNVLGYFWSVGHPLAFAVVFFIAFKVIVRIQIEDYALFLIAGLFPWQWFANSANASPLFFLGNASIIKKVMFPRNLIIFSQVLQDMIHFILSIPVIILFMFFYARNPSLSWLYGIPIMLILQFFLIYGASLFISSVNLFFRDLERLTTILVMLLLYFTPVIYSESMIPAKYQIYMHANPLASFVINWRNLFLNGTVNWASILESLVYSLIVFGIGQWTFGKLNWRFAEVL